MALCSVEDCEVASKGRGLCLKHYTRAYRHGDPMTVKFEPREACSYCGGQNKNAKRAMYCSDGCRSRAAYGSPINSECVVCGVKILRPLASQKMCQAPECCRELSRRRQKRMRVESPRHRARLARTVASRKRQLLLIGAETFDPTEIFARDGWRCQLCGLPVDRAAKWPNPKAASLDHIQPLARGGAHVPSNTQCAHLLCNWSKGANGEPRTTVAQKERATCR